jgi:hypothetical protein
MALITVDDQYVSAIQKGRRLCNDLHSFSLPNQTEKTRMQSFYDVDSCPLRVNTSNGIQKALASCGLSTSNLVYVDVTSLHPTAKDVAYSNYLDAGNGVLVCSENIKSRDKNPPEEQLWPSEILWQSWLLVAKMQGSKPSGLKAMVQFVVVNKLTQTVIWQAAHRSTCTREGPDLHTEYIAGDDGYYGILGSVNGASSMRMLLDHKEEIGFRTVERVVVLGRRFLTLNEPAARSFILLLSSCRIPSTRIPRPPITTRRIIHLGRSSSGSGGKIRFGSSI